MSADEELRVIGDFAGDLVVKAGAGTGKTHALVSLYLHLVTGLGAREEAVSPGRVLVITFTDKAAGELRERIRDRLSALVERGLVAEPLLQASAARLARRPPDAAALRRALAELPRAPIGTFHATGQALLRRHAVAAGLDPGFSLIDENEARLRALEAARAATLEALAGGDRAVEDLVGMMGFGARERSGLTDALVRLRSALAEEGRAASGLAEAYAPERLAAAERSAREALFAALRGFGALGAAVKDKSAERAQRLVEAAADPALRGADPRARVAELCAELSTMRAAKGEGNGALLAEAKQALREAAIAIEDAMASQQAAPMAFAIEALLARTDEAYVAWKRGAGVVDFGDLIQLPRALLRERAALREREQARYDAILVDEFQDTNATQADLVELLSGPRSGEGGRRFLVGDRKQSIYEFRGADVGVFTEVTSTLLEAGAAEVLLRRSFRSVPRVVAFCNELFARAFGPGVAGASWSLSFDRERDALSPTRQDVPDAAVELLSVLGPDEARPEPQVLRRREARAIAAHMRALVGAGRRVGELTLLLRRYTHLATYLEALRREGLPHYVVRGRGFYEAQEIRDVASLLLLLHDAGDRIALVSVLRSPLCGLSDDALAAFGAARVLELEALLGPRAPIESLAPDDRDRLAAFLARLAPLRAVHDRLAPDALLREAAARFDLRAIWAGCPDGVQKLANFEQLVTRAGELARDQRGAISDLPAFVRWLGRAVRPQATLEAEGAQIVDERDDVVRVMTIHQAKGLQFPVVYVADCGARARADHGPIYYAPSLGIGVKAVDAQGERMHSSPSRAVAALQKARQRAESLRLFYVAATRARDRLVFSGERAPAPRSGEDRDESWRRALDALSADPSGAALFTIVDGRALLDRKDVAPVPPPLAAPALAIEELPALRPFVPVRAASLRVAVTQLQDFARCARRYHLFHELGLEEQAVSAQLGREASAADPLDGAQRAEDPLRAGTLAHRLLERCRFGLSGEDARAELESLLLAEGYDPKAPGPREIAAHVQRFLETPFARALSGGALRRELPFTLALPAEQGQLRQLRGQIDLVVLDPEGVSVLDYKHARRGAPEEHRFQLDAYALAAAALYPRAPRVRVGLAFLREADPSPTWVEVDPRAAIEARLGEVVERLAQARLRGERPAEPRPTCDAIRCGYVSWCHPEVRA